MHTSTDGTLFTFRDNSWSKNIYHFHSTSQCTHVVSGKPVNSSDQIMACPRLPLMAVATLQYVPSLRTRHLILQACPVLQPATDVGWRSMFF